MSGQEIQLLANALTKGFTLGELRELVLIDFNEHLESIVNTGAPLAQITLDLVSWVNRGGHSRIESFLQAVEKARPDNEHIKRIVNKFRSVEFVSRLAQIATINTTSDQTQANLDNPSKPSVQGRPRKFKAVLFDLDGTLLSGYQYSWILVWWMLELPEFQHKDLRRLHQKGEIGYDEWCKRCCDAFRKAGLRKKMLSPYQLRQKKCSFSEEFYENYAGI